MSEMDDLRAELATMKALADEWRGKAIAANHAKLAAEREAKQAAEEAGAYRAETDAMIATAGDQLRIAWSIGIGIWSLGRIARAEMDKRHVALRIVHREGTYVAVIEALLSAIKSRNPAEMEGAVRDAQRAVQIVKGDEERHRVALMRDFLSAVPTANKETIEMAVKLIFDRSRVQTPGLDMKPHGGK